MTTKSRKKANEWLHDSTPTWQQIESMAADERLNEDLTTIMTKKKERRIENYDDVEYNIQI
jgi:hypothetical protein